MPCICCRFACLGTMDHVEDWNSDLYADRSVILLKMRVVVLDVCIFREAAVLSLEVDLGSPEITCVAECSLPFGSCDSVGGLYCRTGDHCSWTGIRRDGGKCGDGIAGGAESLRRKANEAGEVGSIGL